MKGGGGGGGRGGNIYLSKNEISYLVIDESAFGEVDQAIAVEIWVPIVQEGEV